ncbi:MAG TPA: GTPase HflX [Acholeplasma sp.]|nr:GTPase HflX [Acholeplasma sp.]
MKKLKQDRALLVGLNFNNETNTEYYLNELEKLAEAVGIKTVDKIIQNAKSISPKFYIGSGKVLEIKHMIDILDISVVIFDDPLSPAQLNNLEKTLDVQVIDRSFLILSIFAERARSKASVLEVSLAQKLYMLPRLTGITNALSRQGGGTYNAKGPGETKLELDRRRILNDISKIKTELEKIRAEKATAKKQRLKNKIPIVALVGYTNVGKSSLMNSLSRILDYKDEDVFEEDMLFATLETKTRRLQKNNQPPFILIDTVGFVSKLPHELIASFESTLSDVLDSDLILHVADGAYFNQAHIDTTKMILQNIGASDIDRILVLTKKEISPYTPHINEDFIFVSNRTNENLDTLIDAIYGHIYKDMRLYLLKIPFNESSLITNLKNNHKILETSYGEDGTNLKVILPIEVAKKYQKYQIKKDQKLIN